MIAVVANTATSVPIFICAAIYIDDFRLTKQGSTS